MPENSHLLENVYMQEFLLPEKTPHAGELSFLLYAEVTVTRKNSLLLES